MLHSTLMNSPETLHPALWRASQLARGGERCVGTGFSALSAQLPGGGWPSGVLIELLLQQPGCGELRLLGPALASLPKLPIVLVQPPHAPQALALAALGLPPSQLVWIRGGAARAGKGNAKGGGDALWAAEQILRSGSCAALLFWQAERQPLRAESLRRLHLAAQSGDTLFCALRPLAAAQDASPAPLRLSLKPAAGGVDIGFVKRRGPQRDHTLFLPLSISTIVKHHAPHLDRPAPAPAPARSLLSELVG